MPNDRRWFWPNLAVLALLGSATAAGMWVCDQRVVTPSRVMDWMAAHPLTLDMPKDERPPLCAALAEQVNALSLAQRMDPDFSAALTRYQDEMSEAELAEFYDRCFAQSIRQVARALNAMTPAQRLAMLERIQQDKPTLVGSSSSLGRDGRLSRREQEKLAKTGAEVFMTEASPATKMDAMPLLMEMQIRMQRGGRW